MPSTKGAYDVESCRAWRADNIKQPGSNGDADSRAELEREKLRIDNHRARLKLRKEAGELIELSVVESWAFRRNHRFRSRITSIPGEFGSRCPPDLRSELVADLAHMLRLALTELGEWDDNHSE